ncbi:MAG: choice-of-anchor J domain-containing protein, partial [Bacteroidales bacterium]|nr:choice-of-anchor J domain-containing protein [Bacteroidales bacterium]
MKRLFLFTMMCLFGLFSLNAQTQIEVNVGEGTTSSQMLPVHEYYKYSVSQQIFTAEEMQNLTGTISSVAFKLAISSNLTRTYAVYMSNTDKEMFASTYDFAPVSESDLVFSGQVSYADAQDGLLNIEFATPFEYTGENILLTVYDQTGSYVSAIPFYTYGAGSNSRSMYRANDGTKYAHDNMPTYGYFVSTYIDGALNYQNTQVMFNIAIQGEYDPIVIKPGSLDLGARPNGAWMRPSEISIGSRAGNINVSAIESTNSYFKVSDVDMPATVTKKNPLVLDITSGDAQGQVNGQLAIAYNNARSIQLIDLTATAYTPAANDVFETAEAISFPFSATPSLETTYDNYLLPGNETDGADVVYEMTFNNDVLFTANVEGANGKVAVYTEDFAGAEGPMADNDYNGPVVGVAPEKAAPSFFCDFEDYGNLGIFKSIDADGDNCEWENSIDLLGYYDTFGYNSLFSAVSQSYHAYWDEALTPDNYLVTKDKYSITENSELSFYVTCNEVYPAEYYGVAISTDGENFTTIFEESLDNGAKSKGTRSEVRGLGEWAKKTIALGEYANQELYIAIRHFNCTGQDMIFVDDIRLTSRPAKRGSGINAMVLPAGKYYFAASSTGEFTVNANAEAIPAPEKSTQPTPANFAKDVQNPTLSWSFGAYAIEYQVLLGTSYPPKDVVIDWTNNLEIGHQLFDLYNNKNYFWQVNTRNTSGTTYGDVWSFTTTFNVPQGLALTAEKLYEGETTTLTWNAVNDRSYRGYNVYVNGEKYNTEVIKETSYVLENLPYNMSTGNKINVAAVYDEGESAMSESVYVYVTGMTEVAGNFFEQDGTTPVLGGVIVLNGADELGAEVSYTFVADETGAFSGEILAGNYLAVATVADYQDANIEVLAQYGQTAVLNVLMYEIFNPVKYITATETEDAVELVWGMRRYSNGFEDFETGDFTANEWNNEVSA